MLKNIIGTSFCRTNSSNLFKFRNNIVSKKNDFLLPQNLTNFFSSSFFILNSMEDDEKEYDYDLIVLGGGSGGLACSKRAAEMGKKVGLVDFVVPSPHGSSWGLGGTCVNVGCIPKKLMHTAALHGEAMKDAKSYGWKDLPENDLDMTHKWEDLLQGVGDHIGSINWGYRVQLREKSVTYLNAFGSFIDPHTLQLENRAKKITTATAKHFVIATGGRPKQGTFEGAQHCITSDDIFSLPKFPGNTLVVGGSYVALECAGFINGLRVQKKEDSDQNQVFPSPTVMVRSILLRGFDTQMGELIGKHMQNSGVNFVYGATPKKVEKLEDDTLKVFWEDPETKEEKNGIYDTVLLAIGRDPETKKIAIENTNVELDKNGKIVTNLHEQSTVAHIYAIGDVASEKLELTPVAIQAGQLLAQRLFQDSLPNPTEVPLMDYKSVPTTVFTPLEYGCIGYTEDDAIQQFGQENIEVYHAFFQPLEWTVSHKPENDCYTKLICDKSQDMKVIGLHILGPNAGEVTQGFALGFKLGAKKSDYDSVVGIHPTNAEELTKLDITKSSGVDPQRSGC